MVLKQFSTKRNIGFPLLSDTGSRTIIAYGLLNESAGGNAEGIPHPVTILLDGQGIIRAKLGFDGYRQRHTSEDLLTAVNQLKTK